jgi:hypothetical protein
MNPYIKEIQEKIQPLRDEIVNHQLFKEINNIEHIGVFMQHHVYAVWDFMSILKSLQNNLTETNVPWFPKGSPNTRFLINEIVVGEESDIDSEGVRKSHFEMYLDAMIQAKTDTTHILTFCDTLKKSNSLTESFSTANTPKSAQTFVEFSFETINTNKDYLQAAIFTFGREDLIPNMFYSLVSELNERFPNTITKLKYYLDRHIEVDGDHHSHLAIEMVEELCGNDKAKWDESLLYIIRSLEQRKKLWDGVLESILKLN